MKLKTALAASVAGTALFALATPLTTGGAKADISNGNKNSLTISGQIVRSLLWADDGTKDDIFLGDGGTTRSRVRWVTKAQMNEETSVGGIIEMNVPISNNLGTATLDDLPASRISDTTAWGIRKADLSVSNKRFGKVSFGQGDPFTNGMAENGIGMGLLSSGVGDRETAGSFNFRDSAGNSTGVGVGDVFSDLDFRSRDDRLAYETPSIAGFKFGGSWIDGSGADVGVKFAGKFAGTAIEAGVGYVSLAGLTTTTDGRYGGSVSLEHDTGFSLAGAYVQDDGSDAANGEDASFWGVGAGYTAALYSGGATKFGITYGRFEEQAGDGTDGEGDSFQVGILQNFDAIGVDTGLMWTYFDYENNTATNFDEVQTVLFSTRLKF